MTEVQRWLAFISRAPLPYRADEWDVEHNVQDFAGFSVLSLRGYYVAQFLHKEDADAICALLRWATSEAGRAALAALATILK